MAALGGRQTHDAQPVDRVAASTLGESRAAIGWGRWQQPRCGILQHRTLVRRATLTATASFTGFGSSGHLLFATFCSFAIFSKDLAGSGGVRAEVSRKLE